VRLFSAKTAGSGQKTNKWGGDHAQIAFEWLFLGSEKRLNGKWALIRPSLDIYQYAFIT
jgi:hypothetical protein